jgi:hypothetical protein
MRMSVIFKNEQAKKLEQFEYTQAEGEALLFSFGEERRAWAVAQHGSEDTVLRWLADFSRSYLLAHHRADGARPILKKRLKAKQDAARRMAELSREMLALEREHHLIHSFTRFEMSYLERDFETRAKGGDPSIAWGLVSSGDACKSALEAIARNQEQVIAGIEPIAAEFWMDPARAPRDVFVAYLDHFWADSFGAEMGAGNGPAARFVIECFVSIERHWNDVMGPQGSPGALNENSAAKLISRVQQAKKRTYDSVKTRTRTAQNI